MKKRQYRYSYQFLHLKGQQIDLSKVKKGIPKTAIMPQEPLSVSSKEKQEILTPNTIDKRNDKDQKKIDQIKSLTSYNEMIVYLLGNLSATPNFFNIPLVEESQLAEYRSLKNGNTSIGSYTNLIYEARAQGVNKITLDSGFDPIEAQKFAILQLIIKAEDTHGGNIMIQVSPDNQLIPIPIDFGRCLGDDPNDAHTLPRTTRWEQWPALHYPIDPSIKNFILAIDIDSYVEKIRDNFFKLFSHIISKDMLRIFEAKFFHLHANLIMIKESVKAGLSIKQILTLIIPEIDKNTFHFVTQGVLQGGELWPARQRFASLSTSFREAWNESYQNDSFNNDQFLYFISTKIKEVKNTPQELLEKRYFKEISFELRRGLFL